MKVKIKTKKEIKFEPVTFEVTIETLDELLSLWMNLNISPKLVEESHQNRLSATLPEPIRIVMMDKNFEVDNFQFFNVVDDFIELNKHKFIEILERRIKKMTHKKEIK